MQAIPRITSDFHSLPDVGWYGSAYLLAKYVVHFPALFNHTKLNGENSCSLQPLTGKFYTYFSYKVNYTGKQSCQGADASQYTFLTFLALFELGSLLCGVAVSSDMLILGRAVAGMGSSGLSNGALTIIAACVPLEKRPGE